MDEGTDDMMREVLAATVDYLAALDDTQVGSFTPGIGSGLENRPLTPRCLPVAQGLRDVASSACGAERVVIDALFARASELCWGQTYSSDEMGAAFMRNYGWVELFGTRGHFVHDEVAGGFLMLGPRTVYPEHHHAAEEIYIPLTSGALWMRGGEDFVPRAAGAVVHHASDRPHAMKTGDGALLALYMWRGGDLAQKSLFDNSPIPEEASNG